MDQPYLHESLQPFTWWIRLQACTFQLQRSQSAWAQGRLQTAKCSLKLSEF